MDAGVVGRDAELAAAVELLDADGVRGVLLRGDAGIGKTTVWRQCIEAARARGDILMLSNPLELDMQVPFAGLRDLMAGVLDVVLDAIPVPQKRALEQALLLADPVGRPPESSAIAFAVLSGLEVLSREATVLVGIDDLQWLDEPSAAALSFAAHRLDAQPVRFIFAERASPRDVVPFALERSLGRERLQTVDLGPLSVGSIMHILRTELGLVLPRPMLLKVHATAAGNPLYALELGRALGGGARMPSGPLPVPQTLSALVEERLAALPAETMRGLEFAALVPEPGIRLVRAAVDAEFEIEPAMAADIVELDGDRIRFSHPLLAATIAAGIDDTRRRVLHRRLGALVTDVEERARHIALAAVGEDTEAAAALDDAARLAIGRGAPEVAAELLERALVHTPAAATDDRARRLLATAEASHLAGDADRALELAAQAQRLMAPGPDRASALLLIGQIDSRVTELEDGIAEAAGDPLLRARLYIQLAESHATRDQRESLRAARAAAEDAHAGGDDALLAQALAMQAWFEGATSAGDGEATVALAELRERDDGIDVKGDLTASFTRATFAMWHDELEVARTGFTSLLMRAQARGRMWDQAHALLNLAQVEWRAGAWDRAAEHIDRGLSLWPRGDPSARAAYLWIGAVLASHRGELDAAHADAEAGIVTAGEHLLYRARHSWILGFVHLCRGEHAAAVAVLEETSALFDKLGAMEPGMRLHASDLLDAYVANGNLEQAEALSAELMRRGSRLARPRATILGTRGTGLVGAARGELESAAAALEAAVVAGAQWPVPFEHARTLLALGSVQRRMRRRREARAMLQEALTIFEQLGAERFAARAQAEIDRVPGRVPAGEILTPAERRIAELVARGMTNREVADELVLAVHTVEAGLTRIYAKLGVRSRTELARMFVARAAGELQ